MLCAAVAAAALLVHAGLFYRVEASEKMTGPYTLVYLEHRGDYAKAGQIQMEVYNRLLAEHAIKTTKGFGIYYDNPANVKKEDLRSEVGCILEPADESKAALLEGKFRVKKLEQKISVIAEHPFTNPASIMLGIMKAYPAMSKYAKEKGMEFTYSMEIYDVPEKKTLYLLR